MKRRLLPILMTLVLVCALPIWAAFVTSGDVTNPLVSTAGAASPPEPVEVRTADELQSNITAGNSVKQMADINITSTLKISRSLTLDLNGCTLRTQKPTRRSRIPTIPGTMMRPSAAASWRSLA